MVLPNLFLLSLLLAPAPANLNAFREAELGQAVRAIDSFEDGQAEKLLRDVLARRPTALQAARAHMYLGLIALNELDPDSAKSDFRQAVLDSVLVELPPTASPKARLLFAEARQELMASPPVAAPPAPTPRARAAPAETAEPLFTEKAEVRRSGGSHAGGWIAGALGVAALGVGIGFGVADEDARGTIANAQQQQVPASHLPGLSSQATTDALVADVLFGAAGVAGIVSLVLFLVPSGGGSQAPSPVSLGLTPDRLTLQGRF